MTTIDIILHVVVVVVVVVILYINLYIIVLESCIENNVDMLTYYESSSLWIINECIWSVWWPSGLNALVREKHLTSTLQPCTTCRQILRNKRRAPTPLKSVGVWHCTTMRDQVMVAVARTWSTLSACFGTVFGLAEECMPSDFSAFLQFFTTKIHHSTTSQQLFHPAWKGSSKARLSKTAQFSCRLPGIEKRLACRVIGVPHLHHCSKTPNASSMEIHCFVFASC